MRLRGQKRDTLSAPRGRFFCLSSGISGHLTLRLALSGSEGHLLNTHSVPRFENSDGQVFTEIDHSCFSSMFLFLSQSPESETRELLPLIPFQVPCREVDVAIVTVTQ